MQRFGPIINGTTDAAGRVSFRLPEGTYKFRADHQGSQYWATETVTADQVNIIDLNTGGGTSDGRYIAPLGTEVLELGLLNTSIHQIDERTPVADLDRLYAAYYDIIRRTVL